MEFLWALKLWHPDVTGTYIIVHAGYFIVPARFESLEIPVAHRPIHKVLSVKANHNM
jgi:hypothetical protein